MSTRAQAPVKEIDTLAQTAAHPGRQYEELWLTLARRGWMSIVIVPATRRGSTATLASELAEIGKRLTEGPVTAISLTSIDYGSARSIAGLLHRLRSNRHRAIERGPVVDVSASIVVEGREAENELREIRRGGVPVTLVPDGQMIISIPPLLEDPLGLAVALAADTVVISIDMGRETQIPEVRRTVELIGRDRIAGCVIVG